MNAKHFQEVLLPLHIKLQGLYREKCGDWVIGDSWKYPATGDVYIYSGWTGDPPECAIMLPRTIDDSSPEAQKRSLWGMVDWTILQPTHAGPLYWGLLDLRTAGKLIPTVHKGLPTEAILKALCTQEGIEL